MPRCSCLTHPQVVVYRSNRLNLKIYLRYTNINSVAKRNLRVKNMKIFKAKEKLKTINN